MWIALTFTSALLLGFYDIFKKRSVNDNAILPVLFFSTMISALIFLPFIFISHLHPEWFLNGYITSNFYVEPITSRQHLLIMGKTLMILLSWMCSYTAMKYLPITIVGPVNQLRPSISLVLMLLVFHNPLNAWQWIGIVLAIVSFYLMGRSGKLEGIRFESNKWVYMLLASAVLIAVSGIYDKFLLSGEDMAPVTIQAWYTIYEFLFMIVFVLILWYPIRKTHPFEMRWAIVIMAVFLSLADCIYLSGLKQEDVVMALVPLILNGVRLVLSFFYGALLFHEKNIKSKIVPLTMIIVALILFCIK